VEITLLNTPLRFIKVHAHHHPNHRTMRRRGNTGQSSNYRRRWERLDVLVTLHEQYLYNKTADPIVSRNSYSDLRIKEIRIWPLAFSSSITCF
jgi:hypothetical protein